MLSSDVRDAFLNFFAKNGHTVLDSSSVIPYSDPTLLFVNAGMVPFKNIFTGLESTPYTKAATSQKCIRAGGKHNDLDQVGFTERHHTFFEMLGNFSFGDYFKEDAINFAWTLLTKEFKIPKEKLLVTIYHNDEDAKQIWRKIAGDITIIPIATSDNFWSMGDVGPCGPCSEIFYDHGDTLPGGMPGTPNEYGSRYVEIWNIVFMQYEQKESGDRITLKRQSIDTGMGLERITSVLQGLHDNYKTDLFANIIGEIKRISHTNHDVTYSSYKVIADHIRSISFLVADGVLPSNEGRGYVLRRILRRAMRHGNMLGIADPFLFQISDILIEEMGAAYPDLKNMHATIKSIIHNEEEKFLMTLDRGLKVLQTETKGISSGEVLGGNVAFKLYDTYGFPLDLTQDILKSENISVDVDGFNAALDEQKKRAKWSGSGALKESEIWLTINKKLKPTEFFGYEEEGFATFEGPIKIAAIIKDDAEIADASAGDRVFVIVAPYTLFYAESGGQCGDTGVIKKADGTELKVTNTLKFCDSIIAHEAEVVSGKISVEDIVTLHINTERRKRIRANHTATHLLQAALRSVLGEHVMQRGSFHNEHQLRFDFSHNSAVSPENIKKVEQMVNGWIFDWVDVSNVSSSRDEARSHGAIAFFEEKYSGKVRVVYVHKNISCELCGGTHVSNTSKIGCFKILSEASIGSGIRRIEAVTGAAAFEHFENSLKTKDEEISDLQTNLKKKNQEIVAIRKKHAVDSAEKTSRSDVEIIKIILDGYDIEELRSILEALKSKYKEKSIIIAISKDRTTDKISAVIAVSTDIQKQYHAGNLLKVGLSCIDGKGGGSAVFAQGGGLGATKIDIVLENIVGAI